MLILKITVNKIKCKKCGDVIESKSVHDFKFCRCGAVAVDGGHDYLRRCGKREDWVEQSEVGDNTNEEGARKCLSVRSSDTI